MKYKKLICFDFDATLFHTALEDEGKVIWKEKTGYDYPHKGWWSKPETLDTTIFDTPLNRPVYNEYLKAVSDSENFVILATGRIERLRPQVEAILNKNNLSFDGVFLKRGPGDTLYFKTKLFETFIKELQPEEFIMYDDREEHLVEFKEWAKTMPCDVTIIDVVTMTTTKIKNK
jgi:FMN phosphatase YigB (HAD superfamily)